MTSPIVLITRDDTRDPLRIEWFEDQNGYYTEDPVAWIEFDPWRDKSSSDFKPNARTESKLAAARILLDLTLDPEASVYQLATHFVPKPGAPLEPIVRCDGTPTCVEARHMPTCLGLYRTDEEVRLSVLPSAVELRRRRAVELQVRAHARVMATKFGGGPDAA